jgi:dipeptidyl aminopeptidase/acylaminoacyl peptidase
MNKRLIIFASVGLLALIIISGLLFWATKKQSNTQNQTTTGLVIKKVLDEAVVAPINSLDNNSIWYFNSEGRLFRINIDGSGLEEFPLPSLEKNKLSDVLWPKSGSDFIAILKNTSAEVKSFYDSTQKVYINLSANIQSISWLPDSKRVVYIWKAADNIHQQLVLANGDGTGYQTISEVFWPDLQLKASSDGKTVLMYRTNIPTDVNKIYSVNLDTKQISTVVENGKNLSATWLPSGSRFVFTQSAITSYPKVYIYDLTTKQATDLALNTTLDKVAFDSEGKTMYAAVPKKDNSGDNFVKIDLTTFKQETILEPDQNVRAKNMLLIGDTLYFTNTQDGKFYSLGK